MENSCNIKNTKVGDLVRCTNANGYPKLNAGELYYVADIYPNPFGFYDSDYIEVKVKDKTICCHSRRFDLIF